MSDQAVLYDVPGPRARRRALIGTIVVALVIAGLIGIAAKRFADKGQFDMELWGPLINPGDELFARVWELLGKALLVTLAAAAVSILLSLVLGTLLGTARMMLPTAGRIPVVMWIELFRGLPVVVTIIFVWRFFVELGINIEWLPGVDGFWYLVIGLTLYNSVIFAEILRAGVASLPRGQGEAGRAIGMTERQVMGTILLPQAFRTMLPALISQLIVVLKDTSLVTVAGAFFVDFLRQGTFIYKELDNPIQVLAVVGVVYILVNYGLSRLAVWTEKRMSRSAKGEVMGADAAAVAAVPGTAATGTGGAGAGGTLV